MAQNFDYEHERDKCIVALKTRKATQESKVRRLTAKGEMYELLKKKAQSAINLVGIFHPVFRSKTKVMITSADVQGSYYTKQTAIANEELKNVTAQLVAIGNGEDFRTVMHKKHAVQGSKVRVQGGVVNFSNPKNAKLLEGLFDVLGRPTDNYKRLVGICVDYPKSTATLPKETLAEIIKHQNYIGLIPEIYKLFGKKKKTEVQLAKPIKHDEHIEKMKKLEESEAPKIEEVSAKKEKETSIDLESIKPFKSTIDVDDFTKDLDPLNF